MTSIMGHFYQMVHGHAARRCKDADMMINLSSQRNDSILSPKQVVYVKEVQAQIYIALALVEHSDSQTILNVYSTATREKDIPVYREYEQFHLGISQYHAYRNIQGVPKKKQNADSALNLGGL